MPLYQLQGFRSLSILKLAYLGALAFTLGIAPYHSLEPLVSTDMAQFSTQSDPNCRTCARKPSEYAVPLGKHYGVAVPAPCGGKGDNLDRVLLGNEEKV